MAKNNLDDLNDHMFEAIEMLKNNSDPEADDCEKIDSDTAKRIAELGKVVVEGFKVKANVLNIISTTQNPNAMNENIKSLGFNKTELNE